MTSHSRTLLSTRPQLIPGISLSDCICLSCRPRRLAAAELAMLGFCRRSRWGDADQKLYRKIGRKGQFHGLFFSRSIALC